MTLSYRGINYEKELPTLDMTESEIGGQYRGQAWTHRYPRHIPVPQPLPQLKYRGVNYCTSPRARVEACYAAPAAEVSDRVVSSCRTQYHITDKLEQTHLANIRRRLEHRLEVAKNQGNQDLVRQLEAELKQPVGRCC